MMYSSGTTGRPKGILRPMYDIHPSETSIGVLGIAGSVALPRGHGVPVAGAAVPHRPAGERGHRPADEVDGGRDGALRPGAVSRARGPVRGHALAGRAHHVQPDAQAARRRARRRRPVVAGGHHPRRRPVPGAGEGADDRVVRADPARVLRRHRGQRLHVHHLRRLVGAQGQRRAFGPERHPDPRRRRAAVPGRHVGDGVVRRRHRLRVLQRPREDRRFPAGRRDDVDGGRRRAIWTRTGTCS